MTITILMLEYITMCRISGKQCVLVWVCVLCIIRNINGACHKIVISGASSMTRNGVYTKTESHCTHDDRYIYAQDFDSNYLSYSDGYWVLSPNSYCKGLRHSVANVLDSGRYPEEVFGAWKEKNRVGKWKVNHNMQVMCYEKDPPDRKFNRRTVDGIVMGSIFMFLALTGSTISWIRSRNRRRYQRALLEAEILNFPVPEESLRQPFRRLSSRTRTQHPPEYSAHDLDLDTDEHLPDEHLPIQNIAAIPLPPSYDASAENLDTVGEEAVVLAAPPTYEEAIGYSGQVDPPKTGKSEPPPYTSRPDDEEQ